MTITDSCACGAQFSLRWLFMGGGENVYEAWLNVHLSHGSPGARAAMAKHQARYR